MPTARRFLVLILVRVKLDTVEMEKHAQVDKHTVLLNHEVPRNVVDTSEPANSCAVFAHVSKIELPLDTHILVT